jgi:NAD(P)H-hydrate epimerase
MVEDLGIGLVQMMENAGRSLAHLARTRFLGGDPADKGVVVLAGRGGNGGGAMACARRLHSWGAAVHVVLSRTRQAFAGVPARQLEILTKMGVPVTVAAEGVGRSGAIDVIVDGLIGYSLSGAPRGTAAELIRWANGQTVPILALDTPSGVEVTTGQVFAPAIRAAATMTLALPKVGLSAAAARPFVGELYLADIGVPPELYAIPSLGIEVGHVFAQEEILRLW